jgi:hypothetical protein
VLFSITFLVGAPPASAAEPVLDQAMIVEDAPPLHDVDCPTPTTCIAVGTYGDGTRDAAVMVITDGVPGPVQRGPGPLTRVDCVDATTCYAVGGAMGVVTITNGIRGTTQPVVGASLSGVACVDATTCYAVGTASTGGVVVPIVNGVVGAPEPIPGLVGQWELAIDCPSATCYVVGNTFSFATFSFESVVFSITGGTVSEPQPHEDRLHQIACSDATTCYALKGFGELVPVVNGVAGTPFPIEEMNMNGLTCPTATTCYAVGRAHDGGPAVATIVNGILQGVQVVPGFSHVTLIGVGCGPTATCQAVGQAFLQGFVLSITPPTPTTQAQCRNGGWQDFGYRNQGACMSFVASKGRSGGTASR